MTRAERLQITLLAVLSVLMLGLVGGLCGTGLYIHHQVSEFRRGLGSAASGDAAQTARDVTERQRELAERIAQLAHRTSARVNALERRMDALAKPQKGPIAMEGQMVQMVHLLMDVTRLLMLHLVDAEVILSDALRPLPAQAERLSDTLKSSTDGGP